MPFFFDNRVWSTLWGGLDRIYLFGQADAAKGLPERGSKGRRHDFFKNEGKAAEKMKKKEDPNPCRAERE